MFALIQTQSGYSGQSTGPQITDASDWLVAADIPKPKPKPGQVLIKMRTAAVNPSDLHFIKGEYGQPRVKGAVAGFEGCGDVVAGVDSLIGRRVAFVVTMDGSGAWAQYALTDASACIPLDDAISDTDGAAQIVNPLSAMAMIDLASKAGDALIISAATSQLGKLMIGLAKDMGLNCIALVRRDTARAPLFALGATEVLNVSDPAFPGHILRACKAYKPRIFLDAVSDQISETVFCAMPNHARWVSYGKLGKGEPKLTQMGQFIFMDKKIEGFWLTNWIRHTTPADQEQVVAEVQNRFLSGRWTTDISARLSLKQAISGLAEATRLIDGKVIIEA